MDHLLLKHLGLIELTPHTTDLIEECRYIQKKLLDLFTVSQLTLFLPITQIVRSDEMSVTLIVDH